MTALERYLLAGREAGCPREQMDSFVRAGVILQPRQLAASAAARLCDRPDGPAALRAAVVESLPHQLSSPTDY